MPNGPNPDLPDQQRPVRPVRPRRRPGLRANVVVGEPDPPPKDRSMTARRRQYVGPPGLGV